jgi:dextranase
MTDDVDRQAVARNFRRHHLNIAQFYDWAYRHSQLMPPENSYLDPLGQARTLNGVNALARALSAAGTVPLGYTAVYGVGADEETRWQSSLLRRADGKPYQFGDDFLLIVDPADPVWMAHYLDQLEAMLAGTDFAGFHLDQYGWPKRAADSEGRPVDLAESFTTLIRAIRVRLPASRFMFNNVNDFPVESTAVAPQDATYIEVWDPHSGLGDLGALALKARALRPEHPPILSAYLSCYSADDPAGADAAARLTMASIFSHGATHLLLGEESHVLVHAYYPNNHEVPTSSNDMFARWYDFAVRYGDLLFDPGQLDVTEQFTGGVNEEFVFASDDGVRFTTKAEPGTVWTRVVTTPRGTVLHLINLVGQTDAAWDAVKAEPPVIGGLRMRAIPAVAEPRSPLAADPTDPVMRPLRSVVEDAGAFNPLTGAQTAVSYELPPLTDWMIIWIPDESSSST